MKVEQQVAMAAAKMLIATPAFLANTTGNDQTGTKHSAGKGGKEPSGFGKFFRTTVLPPVKGLTATAVCTTADLLNAANDPSVAHNQQGFSCGSG